MNINYLFLLDQIKFISEDLFKNYDERKVLDYMKGQFIEIEVDIGQGNKNFKAYTMDLTKNILKLTQIIDLKYIDISHINI